jgi:hypothetical protein
MQKAVDVSIIAEKNLDTAGLAARATASIS